MTPIYYIKEGHLSFADKVILASIELYLSSGDKVCLIGKNGCGKSSLMKVICGDYELDRGELFKNPTTRIGYLTQDIKVKSGLTVYDFILNKVEDLANNRYQTDIILEKLELDGNTQLSNCSGGQIRRAHLAKVLIAEPDILLLDEPTNHLDISTIEWLEDFVKSYKGAVICISHDRAFLSNVTNKIWWLDRGILRKSDKGFKFFDEWQELVVIQEEAMLRKLSRKLDNENEWLSAGVTARRKRNQKRLSDLRALRKTLQQHSLKLGVAKQNIQAYMAEDIKKTKFIIEAEHISFSYNSKKIIDNFSFRVKKGEKIGIIGANGWGKTTFLKLLTKQIQPQTGKIKYGTDLDISYLDQHRFELNPLHTLQQTLCPTGGDQVFLQGRTMHIAGYLKKFMFDPKLLTAKVATLSGGEANRLLLAKILINPGNLLILDEPTNDLDMDSLEVLLEVLADFSGTLIIVSHDRDFLDRLVTRSLIFNYGQVLDLIGGYQDYKQFIAKKTIKNGEKQSAKPQITKSDKVDFQRLSYKHQRLLETIPAEVELLSMEINNLELTLSDSDLYLSSPDKFSEISKKLKEHKQKLDNLMIEWIRIEEMQK
jgi:ATP-binding cassette subfamily F protein uup